MSYDQGLDGLSFVNAGRKYRLTKAQHFHKKSQSPGAMQPMRPSATQGLIYFLQLIQPVSLAELKELLAPGDRHLNSRDDAAIRMRIAALVTEGTLSLFEISAHVSAPQSKSASSVSKPSVVYDEVDPRKMRSSVDLQSYQERPFRPSSSAKTEMVDEHAQIAVLIAAAEQGAPLCELCKK